MIKTLTFIQGNTKQAVEDVSSSSPAKNNKAKGTPFEGLPSRSKAGDYQSLTSYVAAAYTTVSSQKSHRERAQIQTSGAYVPQDSEPVSVSGHNGPTQYKLQVIDSDRSSIVSTVDSVGQVTSGLFPAQVSENI